MTEIAWEPTPEYVERANVTRLMRAHGLDSVDELRRRSIEDVEWYWDAAVKDLGLEFAVPYERVLDASNGIPWATWFEGGRVNLVHNCVDRWAERPETRDQVALIGESETGESRSLTFAELRAAVDEAAAALREAGVGKGDAVAVFMPMVPEAVIAAYATAKIGAVYLPIFSGFAPSAVAARLQDAGTRVVFTADGTWRRGKHGLMKAAADEAVAASPSVERVVVLPNLGVDVPMTAGRDVSWDEFVAPHRGVRVDPEDTSAEDVFMIAYTSGTTGRPKGAVHVHGGFLVKIASECAYQTDIHAGEVFYWFTDMGWIMGPLSMVGSHANGAAMVMYEGAPDFPDPGRLWASVERHRVAMLGVSPTLIRALKTQGDEWPARHDLSSLRILGSTGEPWNPEPYRWLQRVAGGGSVPIINLSGGTEVGACFLTPFPVERIKVCSLGGPSLGMDMDVLDADGRSVRGEVGELVCRNFWPGMTRGVWGDNERYIDSYWRRFPGVWTHGDWASVDADGAWYLHGRSDDTLNVAGKRIASADYEAPLAGHPLVSESCAVGVPHPVKGETAWCLVVLADEAEPTEQLRADLGRRIEEELGKAFRPGRIAFVRRLPRTRSGKIVRRAVRAALLGDDPGDLSVLEDASALDAIRAAA
jgi:acetyl-CoA synthetase